MRCYGKIPATIFLIAFIATAAAQAGTAPAPRQVILPETGYALAADDTSLASGEAAPADELLLALEAWISKRLHVPTVTDLPHVVFATPHQLVTMRYRAAPGDGASAAALPADGDIVALYDPSVATVYLLHGWTGRTPAELSILTHELVHHVQSRINARYSCPEEMEKEAFEVQGDLLALFGTDLQQALGIDPFTQKVLTVCLPY